MNNNIIKPEKVDLDNINDANISQSLNQERENIIKATIDANNSLNEEQAKNVNNKYQIKKRSKLYTFIIVLLAIFITFVVSFLIFKLSYKFMNTGSKTTTTTTTTKLTNEMRTINYLNDTKKVRKLASENYILLLSKDEIDLSQNKLYYVLLNTSSEGIISNHVGTYEINNNVLKLDNNEYKITEDGLNINDELLNIYDSEMKYYLYKDNNEVYFLMLNGTLRNEYALFINSNINKTNIMDGKFVETLDSINFDNKILFTKVNDAVTYNNYTLLVYN